MKRASTLVLLFALAAAPAWAYVQPGAFVHGGDLGAAAQPGQPGWSGETASATAPFLFDPYEPPPPGTIQPVDTAPVSTEPVPEPGTLAMASMGLMALGATLRRRRRGH